MNYAKVQIFFEGIEVAVAMKEFMSAEDAEGRNVAIDCFSDSMATTAKKSIVSSGGYRQVCASRVKGGKSG